MSVAIRAQGLSKDYGRDRGLFDLDLEVAAGEVFGYLGPNGAGKTTTIRLLMALIRPTRGRAEIFGLDCQTRAVEVKRLVGYVPGELPNFGGLRGREVIAYLGAMGGGVDPERVRSVCERLQLDLSRRYREYSSGNKQKLANLLALMHRPELLILDEPTTGLDPQSRRQLWDIIRNFQQAGGTVLLTTHYMDEAERLCDRLAIVDHGQII
ncbi:MAG TPA: ABC transporter ATP-binding protein, partial [Candidatus Acidoferrales bacterium]|nr:ABC transporter ATP-binding protein [Candidatus Acidoferrales bacterium]